MKEYIVKSQRPCLFTHEWRVAKTCDKVDFFYCPLCLSRKAVTNTKFSIYNDVWLMDAQFFRKNIDIHWFIKKDLVIIIKILLTLLIISLGGFFINDKFNEWICSQYHGKIQNDVCMVPTHRGVWVNKDVFLAGE